ncbi:MAG: phosphoribosyl-AMP cyclohydrolase [Euryarchaeota archaeon]|nr:phosphoribosyl-AMP cyclohydrolase [Euryarchaeota archaeon]MBU4607336.1 phosphoribosyl-AMP cyclohydrolase [Euryarchaeota archaeon]MBV1730327.1 phosphoribosyl-AMP cyclohydrolase [Methanobacterium sp.]MBV1754251.1 phosphoribosyl-AMP cyclohydrolase [Methanobacterium sp.]
MSLNFKHKINGQNLIIAISQDIKTSQVLMVAYMNEEALEKTLKTKKAHYWSTSREKLWLKGESSGHVQIVHEVLVDCDEDAVVLKVEQKGGACHTGYYSCFYRKLDSDDLKTIGKKVFEPEKIYGES